MAVGNSCRSFVTDGKGLPGKLNVEAFQRGTSRRKSQLVNKSAAAD
jgi:hypothetical protein